MCFTCARPCTTDERSGPLTGAKTGSKAELLPRSIFTRSSSRASSRLSEPYSSFRSAEAAAKIDAVKDPDSRRFESLTNRPDTRRFETPTTNGQGERVTCNSESICKQQQQKVYTTSQTGSNMKTKEAKSLFTGIGKDLRRAATTVGEKLPNTTKKKKKGEKEREDLLNAAPARPILRNPDEIKKAYGHADTGQAATMAHNKLQERGEKLSAIQRRTAQMEADAANYSLLAQELAKKMESKRRWLI